MKQYLKGQVKYSTQIHAYAPDTVWTPGTSIQGTTHGRTEGESRRAFYRGMYLHLNKISVMSWVYA